MPRPWGGRRLEALFGKTSPSGRIGEVWLLADHERCASRVVAGAHEGRALDELVREYGDALLGRIPRLTASGRFPLLLKLIDVAEWLSIQVHPSDADAERLGELDGGKTEMWYVLAAEPRAEILCGNAPNDNQPEGRDWLECIGRFQPAAEDAFFVPPGTVHAIGPGLVIAEIQQTSDITYRLFDWDRNALADRPLHPKKAAEVMRTHRAQGPLTAVPVDDHRELLCACEKFAVERVRVREQWARECRGDSFHILLNVGESTVGLETDGGRVTLDAGSAALVPGSNERFVVAGTGVCLDYYVPNLLVDVVGPLSDRGVSAEEIEALGCDQAEHRP